MIKINKISVPVLLFIFFCAASAADAEELTWEACVKEASVNHPDLISARESVKQYEAGEKISFSGMLPQVDSSLAAGTSKSQDTYSYGLTGTQLLFDGLKTPEKFKAALENTKAAKYRFNYTSANVRLALRTAFLNLLKTQEALKISEEIYQIRRSNLELITLRYESGIEHRGAFLTVQANLAQAELEIAQNKRALEVARRSLLKEIGAGSFREIVVSGDLDSLNFGTENPDFEKLAKSHPSLRRLASLSNSAAFNVKAAQADFFPQLSANAGANKSGSRWPPQTEQWNAGVSLSLPVFEGGLRSAEVSQAKAVWNQARADERSGRDSIVLALQEAWAAFRDAGETVGVQKKFLEAVEERSKIAESQYSLGLIDYDNWTIIEDNLVQAKKTFLDVRANALLKEAAWVAAKGETLEYAYQ
ncbi:MAG: TolC family protein [Candidatus Omnitrophota bacterium]|jgi:outer membrane protein TolC